MEVVNPEIFWNNRNPHSTIVWIHSFIAYIYIAPLQVGLLRSDSNQPTPQIRPAPHRDEGVNSQVGDCLGKLCHELKVKVKAEEYPRVLREMDRLTRNHEKLANARGRC